MRARFAHIAPLVERCRAVPGDFAEFGIWRGKTFLPLAEAARAAGKRCHAVDSFVGCAEPRPEDLNPDGTCNYPAGALNVSGSAKFRKLVARLDGAVRIWEGWIPDILAEMEGEVTRLAFVHLDLDHFFPTLVALEWCWARMSAGGILCSHDWFPEYRRLASLGVRKWMEATGREPAGVSESHHIWFERTDDA